MRHNFPSPHPPLSPASSSSFIHIDKDIIHYYPLAKTQQGAKWYSSSRAVTV
uniref:Uncharacterized protein n=1 Tax=Oryza sativa subsp. japonica TaxID=39947 RepID=Q6Z6P0_ORYSJ|nr:hypothetical protein [Oryza sativa Japonica Group]BAD30991.1 hypothetical protein [Oryza sativa Japonica Group]